jgi:hypothetical protein
VEAISRKDKGPASELHWTATALRTLPCREQGVGHLGNGGNALTGDRFFFEIAIYRVSHEAFNQKYQRDLERYWNSFSQRGGLPRSEVSEEFRMTTDQHFWEIYGGPWRFNQAVGWLRLFTRGSQVRGELWMAAAKRLNRRALREFRLLGKALEIQCWPEQSSSEIQSEITAELVRLGKEFRDGRLILDLECFNTIAAHIDWRLLLGFKPTQ